MKIIDCSFRDGGYYTNWDFEDNIIDAYIKAMNVLPVDCLELGYRNLPSKEYLGRFGYTPVSVLRKIHQISTKKLGIMLNEKSTRLEDLPKLLKPIIGLVDIIRIAVDPKNFDRSVILATAIKEMGFKVGLNIMYMSKWKEDKDFITKLNRLNDIVDVVYMVDSFGSVMPNEVREIIHEIKSKTTCAIGFHGHNNLQLGLINTLTAIEEGCEFVDTTVLGMGRGAGNLNLELLLTVLNKRNLNVDFNILGDVVSVFLPLQNKYKWGTNLAYMLSGANSIPQKEVMEWVCNRAYSFNSIVRALDNKKNKVADNAHFPIWEAPESKRVLIIGGGFSVIKHLEAIREFLIKNGDIVVLFATTRFAGYFTDLSNSKIYCLVGNEAKRMKQTVCSEQFDGTVILPPYPRKMGTEVPKYVFSATYELPTIAFTQTSLDSCTATVLSVAIELKAQKTYIVGYDGYQGEALTDKEIELSVENQTLFKAYKEYTNVPVISLTPTLYNSLVTDSVYRMLTKIE